MAAANAQYGESVTTVEETIFQSTRFGGSQIDGATAITINNDGAVTAYISVTGHHNTGEFMPVPVGASVTIRVNNTPSRPSIQIDKIVAKTASGTTTISWGVVERY